MTTHPEHDVKYALSASLAQSAVQRFCNPKVGGSSPSVGTTSESGGIGIRAGLRNQYSKSMWVQVPPLAPMGF